MEDGADGEEAEEKGMKGAELDLQLGQMTLRSKHLSALPRSIARLVSFVAVTVPADPVSVPMCHRPAARANVASSNANRK
eukprot:2721307-Rhodomonas_salina.1